MQSDYISPDVLTHILAALTPQNELALRVSMATGLRIDDVLSLRTHAIMETCNNRVTVREKKTGKSRRVYIPQLLLDEMREYAGRFYVFEGRCDTRRHRTRQAVWKDLKRAASLFRIKTPLNVSPHTARKVYAVEAFRKYGDIRKVRSLLNHSDEGVTALYIMAAEMSARKVRASDPRRGR